MGCILTQQRGSDNTSMKNLGFHLIVKLRTIKLSLLLWLLGSWLVMHSPSFGTSGQYLVASQAAGFNDFDEAANNYLSILENESSDTLVIQEALIFLVLADDLDSAQRFAKIFGQEEIKIPAAGLITLAKLFKDKDFDNVESVLNQYEKSLPNFLVSLSLGWTEIANGRFEKGIKAFSSLDGNMRYLRFYNCALAYAMAGNFKDALPFLRELEDQKLQFDERQLRAQAQIYSNTNNNIKAISLLEKQRPLGTIHEFKKEILELKNGKLLKFDAFKTPSEALSNVFYLMGSNAATNDKNPLASGFYIQLAEFIANDRDYYNIRLAEIFLRMQALSYSEKKYNKITTNSVFYLRAQLGIVDTLILKDQSDQARLMLEGLIERGYKEFAIFDSLADIFRAREEYVKAIKYYDMALENVSEHKKPQKWATFFVRGIAHDQSGNWKQAKVDLKFALELYPNHPEVLNYLGYSLIERNENLSEALKMIEDAVSQKPESGYIVDSLAWGLFRLGRYEAAMVPMERAIQLEPHDPIVNDHLGDILWMTGRKREAAFQWERALIFAPTIENEEKIREKLRSGITDL